jgi:glucokinase
LSDRRKCQQSSVHQGPGLHGKLSYLEYEMPKSKRAWVGFDLGGTKMLSIVFDDEFEKLGKKRKKTRGFDGQDVGVERITETIYEALSDANCDVSDLGGIGVGCPSPVDMNRGIIHEAVNLGWKDMPLKKMLESEFKCPVEIANDVDIGVYGEFRFGAAKNASNVLGVFPGTGIGGGFVYNREILRGRATSCMEIGHIQVRPQGRLCGCGRYGCLETESSRLAIAAEIAKAAYRGEAPTVLAKAGTTVADIRSGVIAASVEADEKAVVKIVTQAAQQIGHAVASVVHLLAPDCVVLGGGLVESMPDLFVKHVGKSANERVLESYADSFEVVAAKLGDDATVLGAATWVEHLHGNGNRDS